MHGPTRPLIPPICSERDTDGELRSYKGVSYDTVSYDDKSGQLPGIQDNSIDANDFLTVTVTCIAQIWNTKCAGNGSALSEIDVY